jgi:hypothetical protein
MSFFNGLGSPHFNFSGIEIIADPYCPKTISVQVRFPRSKRSRIRKKWRKDPKNWAEQNVMFLFHKGRSLGPTTTFVHPEIYAVLRNFILPSTIQAKS